MELSRRQTLTVLAITAAAAIPASAARASTQPAFGDVDIFPSADGTLKVAIICPVPVVSATARMTDHLGAEVRRYQLTNMTPGSFPSLWSTGPLGVSAPGNYTMSWEAVSQDGGEGSAQSDFFLWLSPEFDVTVTPGSVSPAQRTVKVSGTAIGTNPMTRAQAPLAGLPLLLGAVHFDSALPNPSPVTLVSAADGSYTGQLTLAGNARVSVATNAPPEQTLVRPGIEYRTVPADTVRTRITLEIGATHVNRGESAILDGLLEYNDHGTWLPLPARTVTATFGAQAGQQVTTNGQGRFRATTVPTTWGSWGAYFAGEPFHDQASAESRAVFVRHPTHFEAVKVSRTRQPGDRWEMSGLVYALGAWANPTVVLQFRPTRSSGWVELASVVADQAEGSGMFSFIFPFKPPTIGQVRALLVATDHTQEAVSDVYAVRPGLTGTAPQQVSGPQAPVPDRFTPERPTHR